MRPRFSLLTLLGATAYVAVCCPMFISPKLWWGTLVVVATIAVLGGSTIRAVVSPSRYWLGFSLAGWSWLVFWLGFAVELESSAFRENQTTWLDAARTTIATDYEGEWFDRYFIAWTRDFEYGTAFREIPRLENFNRLVACLSALLVGLVGGLVFRLMQNRQFPKAAP